MAIWGKEHFTEGTGSAKAMVLQCLGDLGPAGQCGNNRVREEERGHRTRLPMALSPSSRPGLAEKGLFQGLGAEECMQCDFFG